MLTAQVQGSNKKQEGSMTHNLFIIALQCKTRLVVIAREVSPSLCYNITQTNQPSLKQQGRSLYRFRVEVMCPLVVQW